ncbi:hypothetical protein [Halomonas piscis]|uniref:hypothetical protein n=1 Tax=Halomonas piscis TaxID=3031727 RepID=UPI00289F8ADA|nr:hypothetical protein [Halomonas piscis]
MNTVGQRERLTQQQVLRFFQDELNYRYLGDWKVRAYAAGPGTTAGRRAMAGLRGTISRALHQARAELIDD